MSRDPSLSFLMRELLAASGSMPLVTRKPNKRLTSREEMQRIRRVLRFLASIHTPFDQLAPGLNACDLPAMQLNNISKYYTQERGKIGIKWPPFRSWKMLHMYNMWSSRATERELILAYNGGEEVSSSRRYQIVGYLSKFPQYGGIK